MSVLDNNCYISKSGTKISYIKNNASGIPLLLIHGLGLCHKDFNILGDSFSIFALDLPGHGHSSKKREGYTLTDIGDEIIEFASSVIDKEYVLLGHSIGGNLGSYIASKDKRVKGLILCDPPFFKILPKDNANTLFLKDMLEPMTGFMNQKEETSYIPYYLLHSYIYSQYGLNTQRRLYEETKEYISENPETFVRLKNMPENFLSGLKYIDLFDFNFAKDIYEGKFFSGFEEKEVLKKISCPALYLKAYTRYGRDGILYSANNDEDAKTVCDLIPDCTLKVFRSSHNIHNDKPVEFCETIKEFISNL